MRPIYARAQVSRTMMSAEVNARAAPALGHHDAIPHPFTTSSPQSSPLLGGLDDHSGRPSKRPRSSFLQSHEQPQRVDSPEEQYVLLSGVKRWWEVRLQPYT